MDYKLTRNIRFAKKDSKAFKIVFFVHYAYDIFTFHEYLDYSNSALSKKSP